MQSRFTSKAQEALNYAADTAAMLGHGYIGSEHLLIGLIKAEGGLASSVLLSNDITDEKIINLVCQLIAPDSVVNVKEPSGYTPRVRHILDNAAREAARFKSELIGTEHILIAIIKETDSVASRLLNTIGVPVKKMYVDLLMAMGEDAGRLKKISRMEDLEEMIKKAQQLSTSTAGILHRWQEKADWTLLLAGKKRFRGLFRY